MSAFPTLRRLAREASRTTAAAQEQCQLCSHTIPSEHRHLRVAANRRAYTPTEQRRLVDLFGEPHRWGTTLGRLLWTSSTTVVPPFVGNTARLRLPLDTFDRLAAFRARHALPSWEAALDALLERHQLVSS